MSRLLKTLGFVLITLSVVVLSCHVMAEDVLTEEYNTEEITFAEKSQEETPIIEEGVTEEIFEESSMDIPEEISEEESTAPDEEELVHEEEIFVEEAKDAETSDGVYSYEITDNNTAVRITAFLIKQITGNNREIYIPDTIEALPVKYIGSRSFADVIGLHYVHISASVELIEDYAFRNCVNLTRVSMESSNPNFGTDVFSGCAVQSNEDFKIIGKTGSNAEIYAESNGHLFICESGNYQYIKKNGTAEIFRYTGNEEQIVIPGRLDNLTVTSVGEDAFMMNSSAESITVSEGITAIGESAFAYCDMESMILPNSLTYIGKYAFTDCRWLSAVEIPSQVSYIGKDAFSYCESLEEITIPENISTIYDYTFSWCKTLSKVTFPKNLNSVGAEAFFGVSADVTVPCESNLPRQNYGGTLTWLDDHSGKELTPKLTWNGTSSCRFSMICTCGKEADGKNCDITSKVTLKATTESTGKKVYTATCKYDDIDYSSKKTVVINKLIVTPPKANSLVYTGSPQNLITKGTGSGGTLKYSLTMSGTYSSDLPTKTNVGIYKVYYKVFGGANYEDTSPKYITVNIKPKKAEISSWANISTGIKLTWAKVTGATGYEVFRGSEKIATVTDASTVTFTDKGVKNSANKTSYTYYVRAYYKNSSGTVIYGAKSVGRFTRRMQTPTIKSYSNTSSGIKLTWEAQSGATGYVIYRDGTKIKSVTGTYFTDTAVITSANGKAYRYTVKAYYKTASGAYYYSGASSGKTAYRVKSPSSVTITSSSGSVSLRFTAVPKGMNYVIYRSTSRSGSYSAVKTLGEGCYYYKNTGLTKGRTYYYKIRAYKIINNVKIWSAYSSICSVSVK
ncbi:MAG: leucine-rich repeat protein [Clostridia bacterium]|nr:leucine-rich repeat protein [Clostridia bacterium]